MSVPQWKRGENLLAVEIDALALLKYSIATTTNQKYFTLRNYNQLGAPIVDLARRIMHLTMLAQRTLPDNPALINTRREYFIEAIQCSDLLRAELCLNMWHFKLPAEKARIWDDLIQKWRESCQAWLRADKKRFKDLS